MDPLVLELGPDCGSAFMDKIAEQLAAAARYEDHGSLNEDEQMAFVHGFRHGVHQMTALLQQASAKDPRTFIIMSRMMHAAIAEWELPVTVQISCIVPLSGNPDKEGDA